MEVFLSAWSLCASTVVAHVYPKSWLLCVGRDYFLLGHFNHNDCERFTEKS